MSGRALRRLREEQFGAGLPFDKDDDDDDDEEDDSSDDDDDEIGAQQQKRGVFAMMDDSDDSDDDSDDDNDDDDEEEEEEEATEQEKEEEPDEEPDEEDKQIQHNETTKEVQANVARAPAAKDDDDDDQEEEEEEEEDLDAILAEFQSKDQEATTSNQKKSANDQDNNKNHFFASWMDVLVASLETRDLDIDYVMRTNLRMGDAANHNAVDNTAARKGGRRNATFLFGPPRDGWARPPHYVGGGIGMINYNNNNNNNNNNNKESTLDIPWPYTHQPPFRESCCWFKLQHSDTYEKDCLDYHGVIEQSGDVNALALFVTHHPYVTEALLQLTTVLYQTNQNQAGLSVLRRVLWIYECCFPKSFLPQSTRCCALLDYCSHDDENKPYFAALFFLLRVSHISGYFRTSVAVGRYLLALDPLRDPMGVLVLLDYVALALMNRSNNQFVVDLVETESMELWYRSEDDDGKEYRGRLWEMPNWAYSYALALHRLEQEEEEGEEATTTTRKMLSSTEALRRAVQKFPLVVEKLLEKNEVDTTTGRSLETDWVTLLPRLRAKALLQESSNNDTSSSSSLHDLEQRASCTMVCDKIVHVYVDRAHKLWSSRPIQKWLYQACLEVLLQDDNDKKEEEKKKKNGASSFYSSRGPSPCLLRYAGMDKEDYAGRFRLLPPEANPLDPGLVGQAMMVDPNRRRLVRGNHNNNNDWMQQQQQQWQQQQQQQQGFVLGGPPTELIDPDSPLMEVLWRSMLPWAHVDGVQPPPRR